MPRFLIILAVCGLALPAAWAEKVYQEVTVADPYVELHTGPGIGYPIFHVIERGETIKILKRRTDWFKVQNDRGLEGWASRDQMTRTLQSSGEASTFNDGSLQDLPNKRWEIGFLAGDFGGADVISGYGSFNFSRNLSTELSVSQVLGNVSDGWMSSINLTHTFVPKWRVSPYANLGTGYLSIDPKTTLVQAEDRSDWFAVAGVGVRTYVTRRFIFRAEYKGYLVFGSNDDNEDVDEWKAGFSVFF